MDEKETLPLNIDLNVLNHLGIKLYSKTPAVLSEVVANAWDADATEVTIHYNQDKIMTIADNGHGMTRDDIEKRYLNIGYERRKENAVSAKHQRKVMGRKGLGKLSLFSIANNIRVYTVKDGEKTAIELNAIAIEQAIENKEKYKVPIINFGNKIEQGTLIELSDFKKRQQKNLTHLKRNLARRFAIIGEKYKFKISVNSEEITPEDRAYYKKMQFVFLYGEKGADIQNNFNKDNCEIIIRPNEEISISGWIGTAKEPNNLKDDDGEMVNKLALIVRGKVAEEDLLAHFQISGHVRNYLIGEIHADYLDDDDGDDIATSNRQSINTEDDRFKTFLENLRNELKKLRVIWDDKRGKKSQEDLRNRIPELKEWLDTLQGDALTTANKLIGTIGQIAEIDKRKTLYRAVVPAVEQLKITHNFSKIENSPSEDIEYFLKTLSEHDMIESHLYYEITRTRLEIIKKLAHHNQNNSLEKIIQNHIYDHLWLLDPSWDRAATTGLEEPISATLRGVKENGRIDIRYRKTSGTHIIVELKKPDVTPAIGDLQTQISKYLVAVEQQTESTDIMVFILMGQNKHKYTERDLNSLKQYNAKIMTYNEVVLNAENQYQEYLEKQKEYSKLTELIEKIALALEN